MIGGAAIVWPAIELRSQSGKIFHLGILVNSRSFEVEELLEGSRDHGYVEGQNLIIEYRFSQGYGERWIKLASELVALKVDAIFVLTTPAGLAAKQATNTIPIIIPTALDPVGAGLAASVCRQFERPARSIPIIVLPGLGPGIHESHRRPEPFLVDGRAGPGQEFDFGPVRPIDDTP